MSKKRQSAAMAKEAPIDDPEGEARNGEQSPFDRFEDFVKKIAAVPKEEVDELRAEREREKKEKRAG